MLNKTVIGFDSWTQGAHHYARLVDDFKRLGYRLILIHIGSWGHEKNCPMEQELNGLSIRDIRYYAGKSFKDILIIEKPAAVLFLSTRAFAHQAFNRYAESLGIPTIHLYHGLVNVQALGGVKESGQTFNFKKQLTIINKRLYKNLFILWPLYMSALYKTKAPIKDWYEFFREIVVKTFRGLQDIAPKDTATTAGCVYAEIDVDHMIKHYHMRKENVFAVGNPDLVHFGLKPHLINYGLSDDWSAKSQVMYIDTSLIEAGLTFDDTDDFINHLEQTRMALENHGLSLILKLHPAHNRSGVADRLKALNFIICANDQFVDTLKHCKAALSEPSSAAMIPALMGLPLLLVRYGKLSNVNYGIVLNNYPRSRVLSSLEEVTLLIDDAVALTSSKDMVSWNQENVGPMPAEKMPFRVSEVINKVVTSKDTQNINGDLR
jgi:hypothetical protein